MVGLFFNMPCRDYTCSLGKLKVPSQVARCSDCDVQNVLAGRGCDPLGGRNRDRLLQRTGLRAFTEGAVWCGLAVGRAPALFVAFVLPGGMIFLEVV